jgi:acyl-CoA thioester hydrolase
LSPAPVTLATVRPEWVDHYGHMNMGFYAVVFDIATDHQWSALNLGAELHAVGLGTFAAENWLAYVREVTAGMPLAFASEALCCDDKRLICRHSMFHGTEGWLAAENEVLYLCVDLAARKVAPWPEATRAVLDRLCTGAAPKRLALRRR